MAENKIHTVTVFGIGQIGEAVCALLSYSGRYRVRACDTNIKRAQTVASKWKDVDAYEVNLSDTDSTLKLMSGADAIISALPYLYNVEVAKLALQANIHYFDLTEDVKTTDAIETLSKGAEKVFMPQCGLAPGFIGILGNHLIEGLNSVESLKLRVGALPMYPTNMLRYSLTWSIDGLINEYGNRCEAIAEGEKVALQALEGYERFSLNGDEYEAFNTSGGLSSLCDTLAGKVRNLTYKTIRYPGHRDLIAFLMNDLKLNQDRETLKRIFENSIPTTRQDKCVVLAEAIGSTESSLTAKTYAKVLTYGTVGHQSFTAIQLSTSSGVCAALDLVLGGAMREKSGFVRSEDIPFFYFVQNEFGQWYSAD